ncbi:MAG: DUF1854 domain-containing protein, partial [Crenarchaeota archaeon]|nr:DUF1854 domain-containing protein [Thermoproteota archaeon]
MPLLEDFLSKTWIVDAGRIRIIKGEKPNTVKIMGSNGEFLEAIPKKPFPLSNPYFIIFSDEHGNEVCIIEDYRKTDGESRKNLEEILEKL